MSKRRNKNPHRVVGTASFRGAAVDAIISGIKKCRVCHCTDADCSQCIAKTGAPCTWVEPNLCSACADEIEELEERDDDPDDLSEPSESVVLEVVSKLHGMVRGRPTSSGEPVLTIAVGTESEKTALERKIAEAGGAESNIAHAVVPMPPEMLAIMTHWVHMGQVPQMFVKITPDQRSIRIVALRLSPEVASRL
jgi:hypothetical protein